jgi:radical SAM protein with 4Fe4S-binding SPASM domain
MYKADQPHISSRFPINLNVEYQVLMLQGVRSALIGLAKHIYNNYPNLVKRMGLLELLTLEPYKSYYLKRIDKKMSDFNSGAIAVEFEVTNKCNADCIMCPNAIMQRPIEKMEMDLFKRIADEFTAENLPLIKFVFAGIGEPTLDPMLADKIRYLKEKMPQIPVQLTTNAALLNERRSKELIEAGLDRLIISFNGTTKESYEKVMGQMNFDKNIQNVLKFLSLRKNLKPHVTISCVRLDANAADFSTLQEFWKSKGVEVDSYKTPVPFNRGGDQMQSRYQSKWSLPKPSSQRQMLPCRMMGENILIHPNGKVVLCFVDYEEQIVMGELGENSLREILSTKKKLFEMQKAGDFSKMPLCNTCSFMREQTVAWWQDSYF